MQEEHWWEVESSDNRSHQEETVSPKLGIFVDSLLFSSKLLFQELINLQPFFRITLKLIDFLLPEGKVLRLRRSVHLNFLFCLFFSYFKWHWSSLSFLILFVFLSFLWSFSFLSSFLFLFVAFSINGIWIIPKSEFKPIEDIEDRKYELNKAEDEKSWSFGKTGIVLCLLVLNTHLIEKSDIEADEDWQLTCDTKAVIHIAFIDIFLLLQIVAILYFAFDAVSVGQHWDNFISMGISCHWHHYVVSQVTSQATEDWVVREVNSLILPLLVSYFNT